MWHVFIFTKKVQNYYCIYPHIVFASKRLYTSLKQNIVTFPMALPSGYPMSPLMSFSTPQTPSCVLFPQFLQNAEFFSFLANALAYCC